MPQGSTLLSRTGDTAGRFSVAFGCGAVLVALLTVAACSGGASSPQTPTQTQPAFTFTVTDRDTRVAVSGASVLVSGIPTAVVTDGTGKAVFSGGVTLPATVAITNAGYRLRNADVPADGKIDLMPIRDDIGMTDTFLDQLLFGPPNSPTTTSTINNHMSVYVDLGIATDDGVRANNSIQNGIDLLNTLLASAGSNYRAEYAGTGPPTAGRIPLQIGWDSAKAMSAGIKTYNTLAGGYIVSVRTGVSATSLIQNARDVAHELGHAVGLQDNLVGGGIMAQPGTPRADTWSPAEIKAFRVLTLTKVGTKLPDDSRGLS